MSEKLVKKAVWVKYRLPGDRRLRPLLARAYADELFGVHRSIAPDERTWAVTHLPTGYRVMWFRTMREAVRFVELIRDFPEWREKGLVRRLSRSTPFSLSLRERVSSATNQVRLTVGYRPTRVPA